MRINDALELVSHQRVRDILYVLKDTHDTITYDDFVEGLVEDEVIEDYESERFRISMSHNYLPKIAGTGVIDYDDRTETICYVGDPDMEKILEFLEDLE